mmetsp:Transcript_19770/g.46321  ORF Transcript_19770/g.46321 Transcript_19770/m.46321 type:complete len:91 (+) Transcript_19770:177-449(+)
MGCPISVMWTAARAGPVVAPPRRITLPGITGSSKEPQTSWLAKLFAAQNQVAKASSSLLVAVRFGPATAASKQASLCRVSRACGGPEISV